MNKLMKALFSVLICALVAVPATVMGSLTPNPALVGDTDIRVTADEDIVLSVATNYDGLGEVEYELFIDGVSFGDITIQDKADESYDFVEIPVTYLYSKLGEDLENDLTGLTVELGAIDLGTINVSVADGETTLYPGLIKEIDVEDKDLTFNDALEFEIEFEGDEDELVENAYFEVALFDEDGDKVAGWIQSEDDNIRFDDDDEIVFDQDDLTRALVIPSSDDIDAGELTFRVEVYGDYIGYHNHLLDTADYIFEVEKLEDHLNIEAVTFEQQGNVLYTAITVENDGEENQEDVRARVQITELDVKQTSNTMTVYEDDDATIYVPVVLPTLATGEYDIKVTVYNDEISVSETVEAVELTGIMAPAGGDGVVIGVDTAIKTVSENGAVYAMTFTNQGVAARTFTLETAGAEWAQTSVNPATVVVGAGSSEIASVFVAPNAGEQGMRQFTVFIKEGAQIVKTISLTANVEGGSPATGSAVFDFDDLVNSGLKWIAAILVVVLIVLFVMWSWNRAEEEEL